MNSTYWDNSSFLIYLMQAFVGMYCLRTVVKNSNFTKRNLSRNFAAVSLLIIWTFFATFRMVSWGIGGTDAMGYILFFENSWGTYDEGMEHIASDVAYLWINKIIRLCTPNYHVLFAIVYGFITYSIIRFVKQFCSRYWNFIPLILAFYLFLRGYNTLRSNLAIAFILLGIINVTQKKYKWAYLYMICSALTHKAGIPFALSIPFLHFAMVRGLKTKYLVLASGLMFMIATYVREYFIAFASVNDLGGSYESYAMNATGSLMSSIVECFMQYLLAIIVVLSTRKIKRVAIKYGKDTLIMVNALLYVCYFDMMLIPINAALGIWRGYEFLYIPRLCMWSLVIFVYTRNYDRTLKCIMNSFILLYFIAWFTFRLYRTYEASDLMPYILNVF